MHTKLTGLTVVTDCSYRSITLQCNEQKPPPWDTERGERASPDGITSLLDRVEHRCLIYQQRYVVIKHRRS